MATFAGSQVFQASSAALTFFVADSNVNGGTGGLMGSAICVQLHRETAMWFGLPYKLLGACYLTMC